MRQITLTVSGVPGEYIDKLPCIIHSSFAQYLCLLLGLLEFSFAIWIVVSFAIWIVVLSICLLLVCFVSAAGCHCFDFHN